jgi:hypothetical protein
VTRQQSGQGDRPPGTCGWPHPIAQTESMVAPTTEPFAAKRRGAVLEVSHVLRLAAAPVFAIMALVTQIHRDGAPGMCASTQEAWPLSGMVSMYLLMSIFHSPPWLGLISDRNQFALEEPNINAKTKKYE